MNDVSSSDITNIIVNEDDFGHEMRVGAILRGCSSAVVEHGGTYTDPVSHKPRQFDYRCWSKLTDGRLTLAIECKNIHPSIPVIVCGASRNENEAFHELIESRQGRFDDGNVIQVGLSSITRRVSMNNLFYPTNEFVGKSLLRPQLDKKATSRTAESDIYDRWAQALSSAFDLAESARFAAKHLSLNSVFTAVLPMVVLPSGTLWQAKYDDSGQLISKPARIEHCAFFVGREIEVAGPPPKPWFQTFTFSHVHFLTIDGLNSFLSALMSDSAESHKLFVSQTEACKISAAYPRDPANIQRGGSRSGR